MGTLAYLLAFLGGRITFARARSSAPGDWSASAALAAALIRRKRSSSVIVFFRFFAGMSVSVARREVRREPHVTR